MNFIEALKESLNGIKVISCIGVIYDSNNLNPKRLSDTSFVCDSITSERERKGNWELLNK